MKKGEDARRTVQLGQFDEVSEDLLDPAMPGASLDELLAYADSGHEPEISAGPQLPRSGWRMIEEHSGLSQISNQTWVAPAADGTWHQVNLVTLRRDGSKRVRSAPVTLHVHPCRADRREPLRLEWLDESATLAVDLVRDHNFRLKLTNTNETIWLNSAQDKSTLDLRYAERSPGFIELAVGEDLPDLEPSQSVIVIGRLADTPPVGSYAVVAELVDLRLETGDAVKLTVTD